MDALRSGLIGLAVLLGAALGALPATADGGPRAAYHERPLYSIWQGLYGGVHVGWGESGDADGFVGGAQIGYNWQANQFVYGLEADLSLSDISQDVRVFTPFGTVSANGSIDWMATVRGRAGVLLSPNLLLYATAGLGVVSGEGRVNAFGVQISGNDSASGFAYGIGLENKFSDTMSARIEYLGITGIDDVTGDGVGIIRAGLNFKLGQ
jgi:outer membrane immunogenic protein